MELRPIVRRSYVVPEPASSVMGPCSTLRCSSALVSVMAEWEQHAVFATFPASSHPGEVGLVAGVPCRVVTREKVQVVAVVAGRHGNRVVTAPNQDRIAVGDDYDVVQPPGIVVQPLQGEA